MEQARNRQAAGSVADSAATTQGDGPTLVSSTDISTPQFASMSPSSATVRTKADLSKEYVVARLDTLPNILRTLPTAFDDLSCDFGIEGYRRMLQDYEVAASLGVLVLATTAQEPTITPPVTPDKPEYAVAKRIAEFIQRQIERLDHPFSETLEELLDALSEGSAVAEFEVERAKSGIDEGLFVLKGINKKPLEMTRFQVDAYNNIVGIVPTRVGANTPFASYVPLLTNGQTTDLQWSLPRDKFVVFTWNHRSNDPRGQSILRAAYEPWYAKQCAIKAWIHFLQLNGEPIMVGEVGPSALDVCEIGEDGKETTYKPTQYLSMVMASAGPGARLAVPSGTKLSFLQATANGEAFAKIIEWADRSIIRAILHQHLATGEGQHQARAAADVHKDTLGLEIMRIKNRLSDRVRRDLFRPLVRWNFGEKYEHLTPKLDLGDGDGFPTTLGEALEFARIAPSEAVDWQTMRQKFNVPVLQDYAARVAKRAGVAEGAGDE